MTTCVYENCNKIGIYENGTLCRMHKGFNPLQNQHNGITFPVYCKTCNNMTELLNCEQCKKSRHLCNHCDTCVCGIGVDTRQFPYYPGCRCFEICAGCISIQKSYE